MSEQLNGHWSLERVRTEDLAPEGHPGHDCDGAGEEVRRTRAFLARTVAVLDAAARGWGLGWPNCQTRTIVTLSRTDGLRLPIRREIAHLVAWLIDETERRGYDVRPDWTWGYACRAIRGSSKPSNHSWGLAVDVNAPKNPMTSNGQLITDMPPWLPALWAAYGFRWGGSYAGSRKDAMHLEFMGSPADAARYTAQTAGPAPWSPPPFPGTINRDSSPNRVAAWRVLLAACGYRGFKVGVHAWSTTLGAATRRFQLRHRLTVDGIVGPKTWAKACEVLATKRRKAGKG